MTTYINSKNYQLQCRRRNWKILPAPSEKNLPLPISQRVYLSHTKLSRIKMYVI